VFGYISVALFRAFVSEITPGWGCEYVGGRGSVVTGWERMGRESEGRGESGWEKAERVVQREKNGFLYRRRRVSKEDENRVREE
jgi:hypothetical protein